MPDAQRRCAWRLFRRVARRGHGCLSSCTILSLELMADGPHWPSAIGCGVNGIGVVSVQLVRQLAEWAAAAGAGLYACRLPTTKWTGFLHPHTRLRPIPPCRQQLLAIALTAPQNRLEASATTLSLGSRPGAQRRSAGERAATRAPPRTPLAHRLHPSGVTTRSTASPADARSLGKPPPPRARQSVHPPPPPPARNRIAPLIPPLEPAPTPPCHPVPLGAQSPLETNDTYESASP